jgi:flagellar biogenesis protein FliO
MQETYDFYTLIIVVTFLGALLLIAFLINKKKDFLKSRINKSKTVNIINSESIGSGNRATLFEVHNKHFLIVANKNSISNILLIKDNNQAHQNNIKDNHEKYI